MPMTETDKDMNTGVDALLASARETRGRLPDAVAARMLADAGQAQAGFTDPVPDPSAPGVWALFRAALGGWPGVSGLATACAAGLWIGLAPPAFMPDPLDLVYQTEDELDLFGDTALADILTEEG